MNAVTAELTIRFPVSLDYLHSAARLSRMMCEVIDDPELQAGFTDAVELAVSEAFTNAVRHGHEPEDENRVVVAFSLLSDRLLIQIEDSGPGYDLEQVPQPDFEAHPEGGYGLYIIHSMMDRVNYTKGSPFNTFAMEKLFKKNS